eukprot:scaffold53041_cov21-Tisochrysis_lutea.AAC.1
MWMPVVQSDLAKEIQAAAPLLREIYVEVLSREELTGDKSDVWKRGHNGHKVVQGRDAHHKVRTEVMRKLGHTGLQ